MSNIFIKMMSLSIIILFTVINLNLSSSPILLHGIVEGFYGTLWNYDVRADMLRFCGEYDLNSYIYVPKDDPYHRDKWGEPYPNDKLIELKI